MLKKSSIWTWPEGDPPSLSSLSGTSSPNFRLSS